VSTQSVPRRIDIAYLPRVYARDAGDPQRAIAFWNGQHQYQPPVRDGIGASTHDDADAERLRDAMRAERVGALAQLVPQLVGLAQDPRSCVRVTFATCFSILAKAGQAPADREVWRALLGLAKYDADEEVRSAAERALNDLEHYGLVAVAS
jgi:hypothetical protein